MDIQLLKNKLPSSPAFVFDADEIILALERISLLRELSGCKFLYSIKSLPLRTVLALVKPYADGFSVSSLFEAQLAAEVAAEQGSIHLTTPGIRPDEINILAGLCTHISCNSLNQLQQFSSNSLSSPSLGLRVNPKISVTEDSRYDPCRPFSKLGVDINALENLDKGALQQINGFHFHTVYSAENYLPLLQNLTKLRRLIEQNKLNLTWLNFGGGYLYDRINDNVEFSQCVQELKREFNVETYIEPGNAVVGKAGYLVTTVIDLFNSDGKTIAVLDTSVNHNPEVFEYQKSPTLLEHDPSGSYRVILAGSTCLAGDLFGEYVLKVPAQIGTRLVFANVGAYTLVKANRFNGYNLPDIYWHRLGETQCIKRYSYKDYRHQWMASEDKNTF